MKTLKMLQEARAQLISDGAAMSLARRQATKWLIAAAISVLQGKDPAPQLSWASAYIADFVTATGSSRSGPNENS